MLSALPEMVPAYKRLIDEGLAGTLEQGLQLEEERSRAWAAQMKPEEIERRRQELAKRGRGQIVPPGG
jgi:enoyl-CoA hydratase